uniref:Apelin n=1 Tax=Salvator merianae TaxID=96440 RepID=A0A8D0DNE9_SALMN
LGLRSCLITPGLLFSGPLSEGTDGMEPREGPILALVHPKGIRSAVGQNGWRKYRRPRPRPRLSHKGPMPF